MRGFHYATIALLALASLLVSGCASTKFKDSWKHPGYTGKVHKVYLIGVTQNHKLRKIFENEFANQLKARGVTGIPSHPELVISGNVDREELRAKLRAQGTDAVLVARVAGKDQRSALHSGAESGYATGGPDGFYYDNFGIYNPQYAYRYYDQNYNGNVAIVTINPIVENQFQVISISANLYETESAEVIWSALTETTANDDNREQRLREFVETVARRLNEDGLL